MFSSSRSDFYHFLAPVLLVFGHSQLKSFHLKMGLNEMKTCNLLFPNFAKAKESMLVCQVKLK